MNKTLKVTTPTDREIVMVRDFNAPRALIFDAFTKPDLVQQWLLGPPGWTMPVCTIDLRVGGSYHFVWRNEEGHEFGSQGEYREIVPPERIVSTERMEGFPDESQNTLVLIERNGWTSVTQTMLLPSREVRDTVLKTGMEQGVEASYQRLEEMLAASGKKS